MTASQLSPSSSPASSEDHLTLFLEKSHDLLSLVQHENAILLKEGELTFESYIARKMELMQGFEKEAQNLLSRLSAERSAPASLQQILAGEIRRVRDALHINTMHQIDMLRRRVEQTVASNAGQTAEKESLCH